MPGMKTIFRGLTLSVIGGLALATVAQAHGLHADVSPRYHLLMHVMQSVGVMVLAISLGLWVARRNRRRR